MSTQRAAEDEAQQEIDRLSEELAANHARLNADADVYCDDCVPVKHWAAAVPYVNVKLCPKHARSAE